MQKWRITIPVCADTFEILGDGDCIWQPKKDGPKFRKNSRPYKTHTEAEGTINVVIDLRAYRKVILDKIKSVFGVDFFNFYETLNEKNYEKFYWSIRKAKIERTRRRLAFFYVKEQRNLPVLT